MSVDEVSETRYLMYRIMGVDKFELNHAVAKRYVLVGVFKTLL